MRRGKGRQKCCGKINHSISSSKGEALQDGGKQVQARVIVLIALVIFGSCLGNLSQTALNAMFSGMAADFGVQMELGQWVTTLYMLVLGITVPSVTYLMRRFPLKNVVLAALLLLLLGAAIDAVAPSFEVLICGRVLQAVSAGITMPMMISIVMTSFPRDRQATVMGIAGIAMGFAPNIGPTIGGWMIEFAGWRSFFVLLFVCALVLLVLAALLIARQPQADSSAKLDVASLLLSALGFGGLLLGFSNASSFGLASPFIWVPIFAGVLFLVLYLRRQKRIEHPLTNLRIFDSWRYRASFWAANALFASFMGITLIIPLFIENQWGGTALQAGLALLPGTVAAFIVNPLAGWLVDRIGARPVVVVASVFLAVGAVSMAFISEQTPFWAIVALQGVRATGVSGLIGPLTSWGMADLPHSIMTDGSSFGTAVRQACASMGTALMVFAIALGASAGVPLMGFHAAFAISGVFAAVVLVLALARVR